MNDTKKTIAEVAVRILEDWAMCYVEPAETTTDIFEEAGECFVGQLQFKGAANGAYFVVCQKDFLHVLGENLLDDDESNSLELEDALSELTNVLCGNMLTSVYGDDIVFSLSPPEVTKITIAELNAYLNSQTISCIADESPVAFTFRLDEEQ